MTQGGPSWWRALFGAGAPPPPEPADPAEEEEAPRVVDPTSDLLGEVAGFESRFPWTPVVAFVLLVLWLPMLVQLGEPPASQEEIRWATEAVRGEGELGSQLPRVLTRLAWDALGTGASLDAPLSTAARRAIRLPTALSSLAALLLLYFLGRRIVGRAAALGAASLVAVSLPWAQATQTALPLLLGQALALAGVLRVLSLESRHREVGISGRTAWEIGLAGVFFGLAYLAAPGTLPTFFAVLVTWFFLGMRRSSVTTVPVKNPTVTRFHTVLGTLLLLTVSLGAATVVETLAGGDPRGMFTSLGGDGPGLWLDLYRHLLSPGLPTDGLIIAAVGLMAIVGYVEWAAGRPWQAAGLVPWIFLVAYMVALRTFVVDASVLRFPICLPPLFILGIGWVLLRGFTPGRVRRQEYTFLFVWVAAGVLILPWVVGDGEGSRFRAAVTLLPGAALLAGRATRSLWENERTAVARSGIFCFLYLPVLVLWLSALADLPQAGASFATFTASLRRHLPEICMVVAGLGAVSVLFTVRPDVVKERRAWRRASGRRSRGGGSRGGGSRGGGSRGGGSRGGGSRGGGSRGGGSRGGSSRDGGSRGGDSGGGDSGGGGSRGSRRRGPRRRGGTGRRPSSGG